MSVRRSHTTCIPARLRRKSLTSRPCKVQYCEDCFIKQAQEENSCIYCRSTLDSRWLSKWRGAPALYPLDPARYKDRKKLAELLLLTRQENKQTLANLFPHGEEPGDDDIPDDNDMSGDDSIIGEE